jgi:CelD/BcsL family acetyltransferase involved in cellulose biosynthesis
VPSAAAFSDRSHPAAEPASRQSAAATCPFAEIEIFASVEAAHGAWAEIAPLAAASPYQGYDFTRSWAETAGAAHGVAPLIVVARNAAGAAVALLPLAARGFGPLRFAHFLGLKDLNFNLGLFRRQDVWRLRDVAALLAAAARAARPRIDAFLFVNQPCEWFGAPNPLVGPRSQPSRCLAYKSALPEDFSLWLNAHASKDAQKKLRKKAKHLEAMGPVAHRRAADPAEAARLIDAFFVQKHERMRELGLINAFDDPEAREFLVRFADCGHAAGSSTLELHGLFVGDRIVATFGALAGGDRVSGLFVSNDNDRDIARNSPGELIVQAVVRDAIARGFKTFDLGVGEADYKNKTCEAAEPLFDTAYAFTLKGRLAAWAFLGARRVKRSIKRSPQLMALHARLRRLRSRFGD